MSGTSVNVKISAATDIGTVQSSDMVPIARVGDTTAYHATMNEIGAFAGAGTGGAGSFGNTGRNLVHNGLMNISQRGIGPFTNTTSVYTLDRWLMEIGSGDTYTVTQVRLSDAQRTQIGDEAATWCLYNQFTGAAGANNYVVICQRIEGLRRLADQTVTVSFWAAATSGTPNIGVSLDLVTGTGGSPSANILGSGQSVAIGTTLARQSFTFTLASSIGVTLGTNGNDCAQVNFWCSAGTGYAARSGNVGVQSGTIFIWGVQVEIGNTATTLEHIDPSTDWSNCLRFFYKPTTWAIGGFTGTNGGVDYRTFLFPQRMQRVPTIYFGTVYYTACANLRFWTTSTDAPDSVTLAVDCAVANANYLAYTNTATVSADL